MAAYNKFNKFLEDILLGIHNANTDTFKVYLTNATPVATNSVKADIAEIAAGNGYTAGGVDIQNTLSEATVDGVSATITASGGTIGPFRYAVMYNDTSPSDSLISWWDYGSEVTLADGESLDLNVDASGLFDIT